MTGEDDSAANRADKLKELGNQEFAKRNYEKAIDYYSQAIPLDKSNHVLFSNRSASHAGLKHWKDAQEDAKECIRLNPSFVKGYYRLATAQLELKEYDAAQATLRQGLAIDNDNPQLTKQLRLAKQLAQQQAQKEKRSALSPAASDPTTTTSSSSQLDAASARELQALQAQQRETVRELNSIGSHMEHLQKSILSNRRTALELEPLSNDTTCYRLVGKAFVQSTQPKVIEYLSDNVQEAESKQAELKSKQEYLESKLKQQKQNMQEIMASN